jgi:hypothetical protein
MNQIESKPFHEWVMPDGSLWASFFRTPSGYLIQFPDLAEFEIDRSSLEVTSTPQEGVSEGTVEHLYLNQIHPLLMSLKGDLVFHAGAVEVPGGAVAFLGESGRGKSTLTASFASHGCRFMTDDCLLLEHTGPGYVIKPSHASIRLWGDSLEAVVRHDATLAPVVQYTPKSRVLSDGELPYCEEPRALLGMYFLGDKTGVDEVRIEPISPQDALIELARNSFLLDIQMQDVIGRHFDELARMVSLPIFFRLDYPRDYAVLARVRQAVLEHVRSRTV